MTTDPIQRLLDHMAWADERVVDRIGDGAGLSPQMLRLLSHLLAAERIWLDRLRGAPAAAIEVWPDLSPEGCRDLLGRNREDYRQFLSERGPEEMSRVMTYRNSAGKEFETAVGDILMHVALHGAYHRGQIAMALRQGGEAPVNTDFIAFVREGH
jgi:uncharacterized damage-inducible protein DinB